MQQARWSAHRYSAEDGQADTREDAEVVKVDRDELYPYYFIGGYGVDVELTEAELDLVRRSEALFDEAQDMLSSKVEQNRKNPRSF